MPRLSAWVSCLREYCERQHLRALREHLLAELAGRPLPSTTPDSTVPSTPITELRVAALCRFFDMARGDVADLVAEHAGELGLVVHQRDQLAGGVDIAAGDREGVVDRRVEQSDGEVAPGIAQARLERDGLADHSNIARLGPGHRAAEFGDQLRDAPWHLPLVLGADRLDRRRLGKPRSAGRHRQRRRNGREWRSSDRPIAEDYAWHPGNSFAVDFPLSNG